ncbi:MAG: hypothetical protein ACJ8MR_02900 [Povalibacter sp.]
MKSSVTNILCRAAKSSVYAWLALSPAMTHAGQNPEVPICSRTTRQLLSACQYAAADDYRVGIAVCLNQTNSPAMDQCYQENRRTRGDALEECAASKEVRDEICDATEGRAYDPVIDPTQFVSLINNPYAPFKPGSWWEYRGKGEDGTERSRVEVLEQHREILGVNTVAVRDRVWLNDEIIEDTIDWLAQDVHGNVWYFGELSKSYEGGVLSSLEGSFTAGQDGAKPGLWMKAAPHAGDLYRQEWLPGQAEDVVRVENLKAPDDVPFNNGKPVLMTRDFSPQSPGADELKFYVPGIGFVLEIEISSGERLELVNFSH